MNFYNDVLSSPSTPTMKNTKFIFHLLVRIKTKSTK